MAVPNRTWLACSFSWFILEVGVADLGVSAAEASV